MDPVVSLRWRKSSYSGSNGGGCLEAAGHDGNVLIRDTKDRNDAVLRFNAVVWRQFTGQIKSKQA